MDKNIAEICSLLSRINDAAREIALFLMMNEYDGDPELCKAGVDLAVLNLHFHFDATEAKDALRRIIHAEKEKHPEKAEQAAKLRHRISELEKETNKIN